MRHDSLAKIRGLMFDVDGVLYVSGRPIEGAAQALRQVKNIGLPCRFVTNTTTKSRAMLREMLRAMNLPIERDELVTPVSACLQYLRALKPASCFFVLAEDTLSEFTEFQQSSRAPDVVVVGDYGHRWDFALINRIFRMLMSGAALVALHKGRFFQIRDGLEIDTGAFVCGLEYATGKKARVMGKPESDFFKSALDQMGLTADEVAMIGDDIVSDIGGAQNAGLTGILVRTGKFRPECLNGPVKPDLIIDSVADVSTLFGG